MIKGFCGGFSWGWRVLGNKLSRIEVGQQHKVSQSKFSDTVKCNTSGKCTQLFIP